MSLIAFGFGCSAFVATIEAMRRGSLRLLWLSRSLAVVAVLTGLAAIAG